MWGQGHRSVVTVAACVSFLGDRNQAWCFPQDRDDCRAQAQVEDVPEDAAQRRTHTLSTLGLRPLGPVALPGRSLPSSHIASSAVRLSGAAIGKLIINYIISLQGNYFVYSSIFLWNNVCMHDWSTMNLCDCVCFSLSSLEPSHYKYNFQHKTLPSEIQQC